MIPEEGSWKIYCIHSSSCTLCARCRTGRLLELVELKNHLDNSINWSDFRFISRFARNIARHRHAAPVYLAKSEIRASRSILRLCQNSAETRPKSTLSPSDSRPWIRLGVNHLRTFAAHISKRKENLKRSSASQVKHLYKHQHRLPFGEQAELQAPNSRDVYRNKRRSSLFLNYFAIQNYLSLGDHFDLSMILIFAARSLYLLIQA